MWEVRVTPAGDFDNHAFKSNHFEVRPLSAAMGAEVVGVRLPDLSDEAFEQFKQALYRHKMLYLRDQHLTHAEHEAFAARLVPFAVDAYTQGTWDFAESWSATLGLRRSEVHFDSEDHYIVTGNGDDSGRVTYNATSPVAGLVFKAAPWVHF